MYTIYIKQFNIEEWKVQIDQIINSYSWPYKQIQLIFHANPLYDYHPQIQTINAIEFGFSVGK